MPNRNNNLTFKPDKSVSGFSTTHSELDTFKMINDYREHRMQNELHRLEEQMLEQQKLISH